MSDLQALADLVRVLREGGVATYEGDVPDATEMDPVKLALRPPTPVQTSKPVEEKPDRPRVPAGLHGMV